MKSDLMCQEEWTTQSVITTFYPQYFVTALVCRQQPTFSDGIYTYDTHIDTPPGVAFRFRVRRGVFWLSNSFRPKI
jgi:hypothetical protein